MRRTYNVVVWLIYKKVYINKNINSERATKQDYYNFIKDRFKPYSFSYSFNNNFEEINHNDNKDIEKIKQDNIKSVKSIGFLADEYDLENDKVAKEFIFETSDGILNYNTGNYTTVIAIALQEAINKLENYENRLAEQERKIEELNNIILNLKKNNE